MQTRDSEIQQFEALFNHASMGIAVVNAKGKIQSVNPFALKLFGYSSAELIEKPIELLIPARYHHKHVEYREGYVHKSKSRPMGLGLDLFARKKDGTEFPVEVSLASYQDEEGKNVIAFISDISVRKRVESEIINLKDGLEATVRQRTNDLEQTLTRLETALEKERELSELKTRFVSMASHEFRTPLSTVLSSTFLIEKYKTTEDQPKRETHLRRIISSVEMLTDILNDFLSVGKIEEGKIQVKRTDFNIKELIESVIDEINVNLKQGQKIEYAHVGSLTVHLDPSLIKHIVMNLVSNASKFSSNSGLIEIKTLNKDAEFILTVTDHGIGISKDDQKHLMERFFRGGNAATIQGTGLGLHIVSKYAELMNGTVECQSEVEKGSTFVVTIVK